ncbi:MAG: ArdC-like ssDNA-binding domain-containing protein [Lachnospiraceae bacterium]|nr:ArdC-like ssDNA-binding domain-containing protein [Lachnospiraceae bacterium]
MSNADKIKTALEEIDTGLATINTNEDWIHFLSFQAQFYNYSFGNAMLIFMQRPDATYVKGYKAWNQIGRHVVKGAKGIGILCPCIRKIEVIKEPLDTNVYNDKEAEKEIKKVISGFRMGYVYDLSDTAGDDSQLPVLVTGLLSSTDEEKALYESLISYVSKEYCVQECDCGSSKGSYNLETHVISINNKIEYRQKIKTLLHEYSHALDFKMHPDDDIPRNKRELIAESTAFVVCLRLGVDTSSYSFSYLKSWLKEPNELKEIADSVQKISYEIINGLAGSSDSAFLNLKEESEE